MGPKLCKCECSEIDDDDSELDFSVFDTDIVQIASYDNEGYDKVLRNDKDIITAIVRTAEVAVEVKENDPFAIDNQDGGYEYISIPKRQPSESSKNASKPLTATQTTHPTAKRKSESDQDSVVLKRQDIKASKVIRQDKAPLKRNSESDKDSVEKYRKEAKAIRQRRYISERKSESDKDSVAPYRKEAKVLKAVREDREVIKKKTDIEIDEEDAETKRGAAIHKPPPPPPRTSSGDKSLPRLERMRHRSASMTKTPPLPPRKFGKRKLAHHSSKSSVKSTGSHKSNKGGNKSSRSSSTSLKSGSQKVLSLSEVHDISKDEFDSTTAVYWEIGDVVNVDESAGQQNSSLRHSVGDRKIVAVMDFGTSYTSWAYSFRDDFLVDPGDITTKDWGSENISSSKAPTCILLTPDGERVVAFGYEAEKRFAELVSEGRHREYYYFSRFKMELHRLINKVHGLNNCFELADFSGKLLPATKVFGLAIGWLKDDLLRHLRNKDTERFGTDDIHWILTIPAVWSRTAKQFMRDSAKVAAIFSKQLSIVLEPEAVSVICHHEAGKLVGFDLVKAGSQYVIVDAAGGTTDLVAIEIDGNNSPKIIASAYVSNLGGLSIDIAFERMFKDILGVNVFNRFFESSHGDYMELMRNFETAKRSIAVKFEDDIIFNVPMSLVDIYHKRTAKGLDSNKVIKHLNMCFSDNQLHCSASLFKDLFKDTCDEITKHICQLLEKDKVTCVTAILMTGGFSECGILQAAVQRCFPHLRLIVLNDAPLSVLKGAIMYGHMQIS